MNALNWIELMAVPFFEAIEESSVMPELGNVTSKARGRLIDS
jgi:hypothetical protein